MMLSPLQDHEFGVTLQGFNYADRCNTTKVVVSGAYVANYSEWLRIY